MSRCGSITLPLSKKTAKEEQSGLQLQNKQGNNSNNLKLVNCVVSVMSLMKMRLRILKTGYRCDTSDLLYLVSLSLCGSAHWAGT